MKTELIGSWLSERSNIPDYQPGHEWLHFTREGNDTWEIGQHAGKGRSSINRIVLKEEGEGYALFLVQDGVETATARIDHQGFSEIRVAPLHGFITFFKKTKEPSKTPQTTRTFGPPA